jgi:hypothetical protein
MFRQDLPDFDLDFMGEVLNWGFNNLQGYIAVEKTYHSQLSNSVKYIRMSDLLIALPKFMQSAKYCIHFLLLLRELFRNMSCFYLGGTYSGT